jgi:nicotinamide riboside transporter PnuC
VPRFLSRARVVDVAVVVFALALPTLSQLGALPFSLLESLGFATGSLSVWLVVHASVWTWPVGIRTTSASLSLF